MMSYINETDFVIENKELVYPEIITDGLQLYYDAKGKRDTDYHRDTMLDMSGNKNHGKLHNFAYEKHSGYKDGLVFDYIDDKLVRPALSLKPDDFTFMLNGNIISFSPDGTVKRIQDGEVIESKGFNLFKNGNFWNGVNHIRFSHTGEGAKGVVHNNELVVDRLSSASLEVYYQFPDLPKGVYYQSVRMKTNSSDDGMQNYATEVGIDSNANVRHSGSGEFEKLEMVFDVTNEDHNNGNLRILDSSRSGDISNFPTVLKEAQLINLTHAYGPGNEPTLEEIQAEPDKWQWLPNPLDLIEAEELKGNILGDMENIIDGLYKTEILSGEEVYTDKADDDAVVHVDIDGKSYQHAGSGKNLFDGKVEPGYYDMTNLTERATTAHSRAVNLIKVKENTTYTMTRDTAVNGFFHFIDASLTLISAYARAYKEVTFITPPGTKYLLWHIDDPNNNTRDFSKFQLEEGSIATAYELPAPTPDYPIEIHSLNDFDVVSSVGKTNFMNAKTGIINQGYNKPWEYNESTNTLTSEVRSENKIIISSTAFRSAPTGKWDYYTLSGYLYLNGKPVKNSDIIGAKTLNTYSKNDGIVVDESTGYFEEVLTLNSNWIIHGFNTIKAPVGTKLELKDFAVTLGRDTSPKYSETPDEIQPDTPNPRIYKINLLLDEPLRSVGDVKDRLFRDNDGVWKVERNISSVLFDGDSNAGWGYADNSKYSSNVIRFNYRNADIKPSLDILPDSYSDRFPNVGFRNSSNDVEEIRIHGTDNQIMMFILKNRLSTSNVSGLMDWFKLNPTLVLYCKTNPSIETLTQNLQDKLNNLRSFQDSNYVYTIINDKTDNLSDYVADNLKPTLHAKFLYNNWYKEDRVINNLMIYNRALANEEMLQNYKTIKRRWGM